MDFSIVFFTVFCHYSVSGTNDILAIVFFVFSIVIWPLVLFHTIFYVVFGPASLKIPCLVSSCHKSLYFHYLEVCFFLRGEETTEKHKQPIQIYKCHSSVSTPSHRMFTQMCVCVRVCDCLRALCHLLVTTSIKSHTILV